MAESQHTCRATSLIDTPYPQNPKRYPLHAPAPKLAAAEQTKCVPALPGQAP